MNNEDMSEILQKLTQMMSSSTTQENSDKKKENSSSVADVSSTMKGINEETIKNLIQQLNSSHSSSDTIQNTNHTVFDFDINTLLKMKNIMDKVNSNQNDPRSNLLLSLKPYLNHHRQEKLDQYMQFLSVSKIIEAFQSDKGAMN